MEVIVNLNLKSSKRSHFVDRLVNGRKMSKNSITTRKDCDFGDHNSGTVSPSEQLSPSFLKKLTRAIPNQVEREIKIEHQQSSPI